MKPRPRELCLHTCYYLVLPYWTLHGQGVRIILQRNPAQSPLHLWDHARTRLKVDLEDTLGCQILHMMHGADRGGSDHP